MQKYSCMFFFFGGEAVTVQTILAKCQFSSKKNTVHECLEYKLNFYSYKKEDNFHGANCLRGECMCEQCGIRKGNVIQVSVKVKEVERKGRGGNEQQI